MAHSLESHDPGGKHWRSLSFGREEMEASGAKFEITLFHLEKRVLDIRKGQTFGEGN